MLPLIEKTSLYNEEVSSAFLFDEPESQSFPFLNEKEIKFLHERLSSENEWALFKSLGVNFFCKTGSPAQPGYRLERARKAGSVFYELINKHKINAVQVVGYSGSDATVAFIEGMLLSSYAFLKYKKDKKNDLQWKLSVIDEQVTLENIEETKCLAEAVYYCRDLVNEPLSYLTAECFAEEMEKMGTRSGFTVEVFNKKKIESLRMGGLLAVNRGSLEPPTFTVMEWKPESALNERPLVLVGKGVVYDTGGLSLKPTPKSMDYMKSDMAGGAVVASTIYAAAKNNLPVHVIGLVPATENRPHGNAYVPGDVITMFDGTTVEIKNTDAEGRLILADALGYAKKYNPLLVIDVATLTGSAEIITGSYAMVAMGNTRENLQKLMAAGEETFERMVEVPLWEEYARPLESAIADLNNLGVREAQTTIAGKFLEHFTSYPWIHLDIAGVGWLHEKDFYRPAGGTGFGIRLLYRFLKLFN